jgi:hypothetical protein
MRRKHLVVLFDGSPKHHHVRERQYADVCGVSEHDQDPGLMTLESEGVSLLYPRDNPLTKAVEPWLRSKSGSSRERGVRQLAQPQKGGPGSRKEQCTPLPDLPKYLLDIVANCSCLLPSGLPRSIWDLLQLLRRPAAAGVWLPRIHLTFMKTRDAAGRIELGWG